MKPINQTGFSITLVIGPYGGFWAKATQHSWRICLGWIAFTIYPQTDVENFITNLIMKNYNKENKYE